MIAALTALASRRSACSEHQAIDVRFVQFESEFLIQRVGGSARRIAGELDNACTACTSTLYQFLTYALPEAFAPLAFIDNNILYLGYHSFRFKSDGEFTHSDYPCSFPDHP